MHELPAILRDVDVIVPVRIDISHRGSRLLDSFCLPLSTISEKYSVLGHLDMRRQWKTLAERTAVDLDLPFSFISRIEKQIEEQMESYLEVVRLTKQIALSRDPYCIKFQNKLKRVQNVLISIRHGDVEYEDKFQWDLMSDSISPEHFAVQTVADLKLPLEMGPIIAHRIREHIFRFLLHILSDPDNEVMEDDVEILSETPSVKAVGAQSTTMSLNLWERAKPATVDDNACFPQSMLPKDKNSNTIVWEKQVTEKQS